MFGKTQKLLRFVILFVSLSASATEVVVDLESVEQSGFSSSGVQDQASTTVMNIESTGKVMVGAGSVSSDLALDVDGFLGSTHFCDESGANCFTPASAAAGTTVWDSVTGGVNYSLELVGINHAAPTKDLSIEGGKITMHTDSCQARIQAFGTNNGRIYATTSTDDTNRIYLYGDATSSRMGTTRDKLYVVQNKLHNVPGAGVLTISSTKMVGVNDGDPDAALEIVGQGAGLDALIFSSDDGNNGDILSINSIGTMSLGRGTLAGQATLDVNGTVRMQTYSAAPDICSSGLTGALALNSSARLCVCNGVSWVYTSDGSTACAW